MGQLSSKKQLNKSKTVPQLPTGTDVFCLPRDLTKEKEESNEAMKGWLTQYVKACEAYHVLKTKREKKATSAQPRLHRTGSLRRTDSEGVAPSPRVVGPSVETLPSGQRYTIDQEHYQALVSCRQSDKTVFDDQTLDIMRKDFLAEVAATMEVIALEWSKTSLERMIATLDVEDEDHPTLRGYLHNGIYYHVWASPDGAWQSRLEHRGARHVLHHFSPHVHTPLVTRASYCGVHATVAVCCPISSGEATCVARRGMAPRSEVASCVARSMRCVFEGRGLADVPSSSESYPAGWELHYGRDGRLYSIGNYAWLSVFPEMVSVGISPVPRPMHSVVVPTQTVLNYQHNAHFDAHSFVDDHVRDSVRALTESSRRPADFTIREWMREKGIPMAFSGIVLAYLCSSVSPMKNVIHDLNVELIARAMRDSIHHRMRGIITGDRPLPTVRGTVPVLLNDVRMIAKRSLKNMMEYPYVVSDTEDGEPFVDAYLLPVIRQKFQVMDQTFPNGFLHMEIDITDQLRTHALVLVCKKLGLTISDGQVSRIDVMLNKCATPPSVFSSPLLLTPIHRGLCGLDVRARDPDHMTEIEKIAIAEAVGEPWMQVFIVNSCVTTAGLTMDIQAPDLMNPRNSCERVFLCRALLSVAKILRPSKTTKSEQMIMERIVNIANSDERLLRRLIQATRRLGVLLVKEKKIDRGMQYFKRSLSAAELYSNNDNMELSRQLVDIGADMVSCGLAVDAEKVLLRALRYIPEGDKVRIIALNNLAVAYYEQERCAEGVQVLEDIVTKILAGPRNPMELADAWNNLGSMHYRMNDLRIAIGLFKMAHKALENLVPRPEPELERIRKNFQMAFQKLSLKCASKLQTFWRRLQVTRAARRWRAQLRMTNATQLWALEDVETSARFHFHYVNDVYYSGAQMSLQESFETLIRTRLCVEEAEIFECLVPVCVQVHNNVHKCVRDLTQEHGRGFIVITNTWGRDFIQYQATQALYNVVLSSRPHFEHALLAESERMKMSDDTWGRDFMQYQATQALYNVVLSSRPHLELALLAEAGKMKTSDMEYYERDAQKHMEKLAWRGVMMIHDETLLRARILEQEHKHVTDADADFFWEKGNDLVEMFERWLVEKAEVVQRVMLLKVSETLARVHWEGTMLDMLPPHTIQWEMKELAYRARIVQSTYGRAFVELEHAHGVVQIQKDVAAFRQSLHVEWVFSWERGGRAAILSGAVSVFSDVFYFQALQMSKELWRRWSTERSVLVASDELMARDAAYRAAHATSVYDAHATYFAALEEAGRFAIASHETREWCVIAAMVSIEYNESLERANMVWRRRAYLVRLLVLDETFTRRVLVTRHGLSERRCEAWAQHETVVRAYTHGRYVVDIWEPLLRRSLLTMEFEGAMNLFYGGLNAAVWRKENAGRVRCEEEEEMEGDLVAGYVRGGMQIAVEETRRRGDVYREVSILSFQREERCGREEHERERDGWVGDMLQRMQSTTLAMMPYEEGYWRVVVDQGQRVGFQALADVETMDTNDIERSQKRRTSGGIADTVFGEGVERHALERNERWVREACMREMGILFMGMKAT